MLQNERIVSLILKPQSEEKNKTILSTVYTDNRIQLRLLRLSAAIQQKAIHDMIKIFHTGNETANTSMSSCPNQSIKLQFKVNTIALTEVLLLLALHSNSSYSIQVIRGRFPV